MQVISLLALMLPQLLSPVLLMMAQLAPIAVTIVLFFLVAPECFSVIPVLAFLPELFPPLMLTKIIAEVAAAVKPILRRSDRAAGDGRKNDESHCESGCADQFGKS